MCQIFVFLLKLCVFTIVVNAENSPNDIGEEGKCQIPINLKGYVIRLHPKNTTLSVGDWVSEYDTIHVTCVNKQESDSLLCENGTFIPEFPRCSFCEKRLLNGLSTRYSKIFINGTPFDVNEFPWKIPAGAEIDVYCDIGYKRFGNSPMQQRMQCLSNGTFNAVREPCIQNCGKLSTDRIYFNRDEIPRRNNKIPWHVAIFRKQKFGPNTYICGGSIVSPSIIISAAQCFWDNLQNRQHPISYFQFVAGKQDKEFSLSREDYEQIREASAIEISYQYSSSNSQKIADIAVVKLKSPLDYTQHISAICMATRTNSALDYVPTGHKGFVPGYSQEYKHVEQVSSTSIDLHQCRQRQELANLEPDKFCLTTDDDAGGHLCSGESGSGFAWKRKGHPYQLLGVISSSQSHTDACSSQDSLVPAANVLYMKDDLFWKLNKTLSEDQALF
uniref:Peptidase S1 domain-containing protein n=1 Tax=Stomoxys calcitrans TaxID=35570 RepID=A0A1I8NWX7_STOCA